MPHCGRPRPSAPSATPTACSTRASTRHIGYFVSRHVDLPDLTQLDGLDGAGRQRLFDDLGRHTARMHEAGIVDFDYNVHNILWRRNGSGGFSFTLVDINRTRFGDRRLLHCAIALATNAELPRFIDSSCRASSTPIARHAVWTADNSTRWSPSAYAGQRHATTCTPR